MTSFSEAVTRREQETIAVVDPRTGELVDLETADHEQLIDVFLAAQDYERKVKEWRTAVEDELVRRHGDRRAAQVVGDHEIDVDRGHTRVWDADELSVVLVDLHRRGVLKTDDLMDMVTEVPKVDGRKAAQLLNRVDGDALIELRRCFHWQLRGRPKVKITPVVSLEDES